MPTRILVTGIGGMGGFNFVSALRYAERELGGLFIVGTDHSPYHIMFADVDVRVRSPRHDDPEFLKLLVELARRYSIEFLHPHPSVEAKVVSENRDVFLKMGVKLYLPDIRAIYPSKDLIAEQLRAADVPVPETVVVRDEEDVYRAFDALGGPLWIRAKEGAGGRLSLKVNSPEEALYWIRLNAVQGRAKPGDFLLQRYLPGRDVAYDSLWYEGRLVMAYARERLEYPLRHISLSGITGTPSVARSIREPEVDDVGRRAVLALDPRPHGFYSVDLKQGADGRFYVTEVDGKWHTTAPLWGEAFARAYGDQCMNLAFVYLELGLGRPARCGEGRVDAFPECHYLIRQMDMGVLLYRESDGRVWRIR
ncbi:MAG: hypothetical protein ACP5KY_09445 [Thermoproteus sp.]